LTFYILLIHFLSLIFSFGPIFSLKLARQQQLEAIYYMAENFKAAQPNGSTGKRLTILSIDGGGVRGIIPAVQLTELENKLQVKQFFFENKILT
jgi:hypothetical protein